MQVGWLSAIVASTIRQLLLLVCPFVYIYTRTNARTHMENAGPPPPFLSLLFLELGAEKNKVEDFEFTKPLPKVAPEGDSCVM